MVPSMIWSVSPQNKRTISISSSWTLRDQRNERKRKKCGKEEKNLTIQSLSRKSDLSGCSESSPNLILLLLGPLLSCGLEVLIFKVREICFRGHRFKCLESRGRRARNDEIRREGRTRTALLSEAPANMTCGVMLGKVSAIGNSERVGPER